MDISCSFLNQSTYNFYISKIHTCVKTVAEKLFSLAAKEEKNLTCKANGVEDTTDVINLFLIILTKYLIGIISLYI